MNRLSVWGKNSKESEGKGPISFSLSLVTRSTKGLFTGLLRRKFTVYVIEVDRVSWKEYRRSTFLGQWRVTFFLCVTDVLPVRYTGPLSTVFRCICELFVLSFSSSKLLNLFANVSYRSQKGCEFSWSRFSFEFHRNWNIRRRLSIQWTLPPRLTKHKYPKSWRLHCNIILL